jgi:hypothetical protein
LGLLASGYAGIDPFDGLSGSRSLVLARAAGRVLRDPARGRQAVVQAHKRAPVNIRPLTGVRPRRIAKALGLIASGYAALDRAGWGGPARERGLEQLDWLERARVPTGDARAGDAPASPFAWGYEFDVQTRWAFYPAGTPNVIATTFVGQAFLDWYELVGDARHLEVARRAVDFVVEQLLVEDGGRSYFAYVPGNRTLVHNANALAAGFVAAVATAGDAVEPVGGRDDALALARTVVEPTVAAQGPDGLWPYGEGGAIGWVDGFHTAYTIGGLYDVARATGDEALLGVVRRGLAAYIERLFTAGFVPKYTPQKLWPVDIHCASSAIDLFVRLRDLDERCERMARGVTAWTLANMYDGKGGFYYQRTRWYTNRIQYIRWNQAHMFRALSRSLAVASTP